MKQDISEKIQNQCQGESQPNRVWNIFLCEMQGLKKYVF